MVLTEASVAPPLLAAGTSYYLGEGSGEVLPAPIRTSSSSNSSSTTTTRQAQGSSELHQHHQHSFVAAESGSSASTGGGEVASERAATNSGTTTSRAAETAPANGTAVGDDIPPFDAPAKPMQARCCCCCSTILRRSCRPYYLHALATTGMIVHWNHRCCTSNSSAVRCYCAWRR